MSTRSPAWMGCLLIAACGGGNSTDAGTDALSATDGALDMALKMALDMAPDLTVHPDLAPSRPTVLASDVGTAYALATDGAHVFWSDFVMGDGGIVGRVMRVSVDGTGEAPVTTTNNGSQIGEIVLVGTNIVYRDDRGNLFLVAKTGGMVTPVLGGGQTLGGLAADDAFAYFPEWPVNSPIGKVTLAGGGSEIGMTTNQPFTLGFLAFGGNLYWQTISTGQLLTVPTLAAPDTAPTVLVKPDANASGAGQYINNGNMATDGNKLYWGRQGAGGAPSAGILSVGLKGGIPSVLVDLGTDTPYSLATDGTKVYFVDLGATIEIDAVPVGGGAKAKLADVTAAVQLQFKRPDSASIGVDSTSVYWLEPPNLMKISK